MGKLFKNKKFVIILTIVTLVIIISVGLFLLNKPKKEVRELKENTYTMYVKINPLVKLTFKETYYECENEKGKATICSEASNEILSFDMLNDDAKAFYSELDFRGKTVVDSLVMLCDTARDNNIAFEALEITSDYNFPIEEIKEGIKNGSKYDTYYNVFVDFTEYLNEDEIIEKAEEKLVTYKVNFDSNGGSEVEDKIVRENDSVAEPMIPSRSGYEFIYWEMNGKKYDFNQKITKDITLKAKWQKKENITAKEEEAERTIVTCDYTFKNVSNGLFAYTNEEQCILVTLTGPKSFIKNSNVAELKKYFSLVVDLNGKGIGTYNDMPIKVSVSKDDVRVTLKDKTLNVFVKKEISSTMDKINLNDNILVQKGGMGTPCGGSFIFSDNAATVLAKYGSNNSYVRGWPDLNRNDYATEEAYSEAYSKEEKRLEQEWKEELKKLTYNSTKASNANKEINNVLSSAKGIKDAFVGENPEDFALGFEYLIIYEGRALGSFGTTFNNYYDNLRKKVNAILDKNGRVTISEGGCGSGLDDPILLTESICKEYSLNCSRW